MEAYGDFAYVYDEFMDNTPYEQWCKYLCESINKYGVSKPNQNSEDVLESEKNLVVDLGCGTGTLTQMLYKLGYDMIGVDNSGEMLNVAMEKRDREGDEILYLLQDMRELELYSTVGTIISVCDSVNYILDEDELLGVFRLVNNYLYPGGLFIFDFNTVYKYEEVIGDVTIAENRENPRGTDVTKQIVIGTPGTVLDWCFKRKLIDLTKIRVFVLDEADVMIDTQGFADQSIRIQR